MGRLDDTFSHLKNTASKSKVKDKNQIIETISQLKSYLVFLNSSSISPETARRLADVFRKPLLPVYSAFPRPSFQFIAALCQELYESKILSDFTAGKHDQKLLWNSVFDSLLSGVLDYHDENPTGACKEAIGATLFPTICSIFFSVSISHMSVELRCTGYTLLSDCSEKHKSNQERLRNHSILGGPKLGGMLWRTRDYLVMENILNLFAQIIPRTNGTVAGRTERTAFVRSVFLQSTPDDIKTAEEIVKLLERVPSSDWDQTAAKIVDLLASSNIAFPQPFVISEIVACGQRKPSDRLFVDDKCFLANVLVGEDSYESLAVAYTSFLNIEIAYCGLSSKSKDTGKNSDVTVSLSAPPLVGREPVYPETKDRMPMDPVVVFTMQRDDVPRFSEAMQSRGLGRYMKVNKELKLSLAESPANLELDSAGRFVEKDELEQRLDNLSQLYGTNEPSDDIPDLNPEDSEVAIPAQSLSEDNKTAVPDQESVHAAVMPDLGPPLAAVPVSALIPTSALPSKPIGSIQAKALAPSTPLVALKVRCYATRSSVAATTNSQTSTFDLPVANNRALDSNYDDEIAISSPTRPPKPKSKKATKNPVVISDDEIEDVLPPSKILDSGISRHRSVLRMSPVKFFKTPRSKERKASAKDKRADTSVSEASKTIGAAQPLQKLSAKVSETRAEIIEITELTDPGVVLDNTPSQPPLAPVKTPAASTEAFHNEAVNTPHKLRGQDPVIQSSSPVPVMKSERRPVKAALRKKGGALAQPDNKTSTKRKRALEREADEGHQEDVKNDSLSKRARLAMGIADEHGIQPETTETKVLRPRKTAAARVTKRYHAKKGRLSSPSEINVTEVDYDKIPDTPPSSSLDSKRMISKPPSEPMNNQPASVRKDSSAIAKRTRGAVAAKAKKTTEKKPSEATTTHRSKPAKSADFGSSKSKQDQQNTSPPHRWERYHMQHVRHKEIERASRTNTYPADDTNSDSDASKPKDIPKKPDTICSPLGSVQPGESRSILQKPPSTRKTNKVPWDQLATPKSSPDFATDIAEAISGPARESSPPKVNKDLEQDAGYHQDFPMHAKATEPVMDRRGGEHSEQNGDVQQMVERKVKTIGLRNNFSPVKQAQSSKRAVVVKSPTPKAVTEDYIDMAEPEPDSLLGDLEDSHSTGLSVSQYRRSRHMDKHISKDDKPFSSTPLRRIEHMDKAHTKINYNGGSTYILSGTDCTRLGLLGKSKRAQSPAVEDLAAVLTELQEAILYKINGKVESVKYNVRIGRERLLAEAVADLFSMHEESIDRYNALIELEADYATFGRNLTHSLDDVVRADQDLRDNIRKIVETHDRHTLSKKMPSSIFGPTPASVTRFKH
ncbi:hypothetical protein NM688_g2911 [Phlebia brevispora]|uniref:Uncharacterized protein n=1 Tax=Phlebia brevispora TaxID=194682 RepID=A0ACC1T6Z4_9APHY|nr:hypothetical protein NM688_g2911 [Phlebia brevispora]